MKNLLLVTLGIAVSVAVLIITILDGRIKDGTKNSNIKASLEKLKIAIDAVIEGYDNKIEQV